MNYWFDRLDVAAARSSTPSPTVPIAADERVLCAANAFQQVTRAGLSGFLVAGSATTWLRALLDPSDLAASWSFYRGLPADAMFTPPPPAQDVTVGPARHTLFRPADGSVVDVSFESTFTPANPAIREEYAADVKNRTVHARWYRHADGGRPAVVTVHGFQASSHLLNTEYFDARWLYGLGLDVVLFQLPYHGARATVVDGWNFLSLDLGRMGEAVAHAVSDFRALHGWLLDSGVPAAGTTGVSLGGYLAALLAGIDDRLAFSVAVAPSVSLIDTVNDLGPIGIPLRLLCARLGWGLDDLRRVTAVHTPLEHDPLLPPERLMVVGATGDDLTRPYQQALLCQHWHDPVQFWHAGSHQFHLQRGAYRDALQRFLDGAGLLESAAGQVA